MCLIYQRYGDGGDGLQFSSVVVGCDPVILGTWIAQHLHIIIYLFIRSRVNRRKSDLARFNRSPSITFHFIFKSFKSQDNLSRKLFI